MGLVVFEEGREQGQDHRKREQVEEERYEDDVDGGVGLGHNFLGLLRFAVVFVAIVTVTGHHFILLHCHWSTFTNGPGRAILQSLGTRHLIIMVAFTFVSTLNCSQIKY